MSNKSLINHLNITNQSPIIALTEVAKALTTVNPLLDLQVHMLDSDRLGVYYSGLALTLGNSKGPRFAYLLMLTNSNIPPKNKTPGCQVRQRSSKLRSIDQQRLRALKRLANTT